MRVARGRCGRAGIRLGVGTVFAVPGVVAVHRDGDGEARVGRRQGRGTTTQEAWREQRTVFELRDEPANEAKKLKFLYSTAHPRGVSRLITLLHCKARCMHLSLPACTPVSEKDPRPASNRAFQILGNRIYLEICDSAPRQSLLPACATLNPSNETKLPATPSHFITVRHRPRHELCAQKMIARRLALHALLLLTLVHHTRASKPVIDLTHDGFDTFAKSSAPILLEFYAPWCAYCRNFEHEYERLAEKYAESPVRIARIDATSSRVLLQRFRVNQLPTFFYIHNQKCSKHVGPITFDSLSDFVDSAGTDGGEPWTRVLGPFHPYWQLVSALVTSLEIVHQWVMADQKNMMVAGAVAFATALSVVVVFTTFIHFLTKPPSRPRPHAE